jgi:hypothetical protein
VAAAWERGKRSGDESVFKEIGPQEFDYFSGIAKY